MDFRVFDFFFVPLFPLPPVISGGWVGDFRADWREMDRYGIMVTAVEASLESLFLTAEKQ